MTHIILVNSIVFFALTVIWRKGDWLNLILKLTFLLLGIVNLAIVFGVKL
jgi:hypothetical protein